MTKEFAIVLLKQDIQNSKQNISYRHNEVGIEALQLAIKALEQQPCEDCISRQELLNKLEEPMNWTDSEAEIQEQRDYEGFIELVKSMPSVTPSYNSVKTELEQQSRWIPVSQGLPEDARNVLITLEPYSLVVPGWYSNKNKQWYRLYQGRWAEVIDTECDVIAWHYFPVPYKEDSNGSES